MGLGLCLFLVWRLVTRPALPWIRVCLLSVSYVTARDICCVLSDWNEIKPISAPASEHSESATEVTIDLEPILADLSDLHLADEGSPTLSREGLTAQIESIRAECFKHPVSHALMEQLESNTQSKVVQVVNEALVKELDEYLGFERYERTGEAKPPSQHRSGSYPRSLRTMWGPTGARVPKLRWGNKKRESGAIMPKKAVAQK